MKTTARLLCFLLFCPALCHAADQFGDIAVDASAIYTGSTCHGYAEMRVNLENRSRDKSHLVNLVYPGEHYGGMNNSIGQISRAVLLSPGARDTVSLLEPPLPSQGDGSIRIIVDRKVEGQVHAPNANNHCGFSYPGAPQGGGVVLASRNLNFNGVERFFHAASRRFTAEMATGAADVTAASYEDAWSPDQTHRGGTEWLELDYESPESVNEIEVYTCYPSLNGELQLAGTDGSIILTIPLSSVPVPPIGSPRTLRGGSRPGSTPVSFSCLLTTRPVKTVRLVFNSVGSTPIGIDAVKISGPTGSQWASAARASSDNSAYGGSGAPTSPDTITCLRAEAPAAEWSETWLAYTPFDALVLPAADLASLPPAVVGAMGDYLSAGGNIITAGTAQLPSSWHPLAQETLEGGVAYRVGFGRCFVFASDAFNAPSTETERVLRDQVRATARYWQMLPTAGDAPNAVLPIVASLKIPTRGIVILMLVFIVAIGPVNIIWLNRIKRRTWMLWTIPAISAATTLLVLVYSLFREGITPDARLAGLTLIDQATHHAATFGGTAFYCPLTPSGGLRFDFDTEATPLVEVNYNSGGSVREVDWSQAQQFRRGWVTSRVPAYFHVRKSETRRERVQLLLEGGQWQVVNGLGAPIKSLWITTPDNHIYQAANIGAGDKAILHASNAALSPNPRWEGLLGKLGFAPNEDAFKDAPSYLRANSYIALLDGNPFIENGLGAAASPRRTKSSAVVLGFLEPPGTP
jgi:hypothetical protein